MNGLSRRQDWDDSYDDDDDNHNGHWWGYSSQAEAVKWGVVGLILLIIFIYLVGGALHAKRWANINHYEYNYALTSFKWLVSRHQRARFEQPPVSMYQQGYGHPAYGQEYPMQPYPPPPPPYNAQQPPPPVYQPPMGASKTDPNQTFGTPPSGPPPSWQSGGESSSAAQNAPLHQPSAGGSSGPINPVETPKPSFASKLNLFKRG
ncbi:uncharacterized protein KY384_008518 [Bacidia gigantensis]|uniref:uncharacterized protein n=1 Tax=Bacidia gigantensis TaxID=2732470 RepID=UPI001D036DA6|nr:uncharacterized protein KY384_008518 [Bacidia gigantensis]KAG8527089.1 hypothetical protein KY384_008518 [Bacidia gigantensis]